MELLREGGCRVREAAERGRVPREGGRRGRLSREGGCRFRGAAKGGRPSRETTEGGRPPSPGDRRGREAAEGDCRGREAAESEWPPREAAERGRPPSLGGCRGREAAESRGATEGGRLTRMFVEGQEEAGGSRGRESVSRVPEGKSGRAESWRRWPNPTSSWVVRCFLAPCPRSFLCYVACPLAEHSQGFHFTRRVLLIGGDHSPAARIRGVPILVAQSSMQVVQASFNSYQSLHSHVERLDRER